VTTTTTTEPERQLRADARRNRERILEAASAALAECGVDAQIDDIARRAGVGVGTVYRHFPTKEALLVELVRRKFRVFADHAREALEQEGDPFEILAGVMRRNAATAAGDVAMQHALGGVGEYMLVQAETEQRELLALTEQMLDRARDGGRLRRDIQPADIGMLMCGVCSTMAHAGPGFDWKRHLELAIDALRAAPQG
jgi:AcrR family transcriptional regulator